MVAGSISFFCRLHASYFVVELNFFFLSDRSLPRSEFLLFLVNSKLFLSGSLSPIASLQDLCCRCTSIHSHFCYFIPLITLHLVDKSPCRHSNSFFLLSATPRGIYWSYSKLFPLLVVPLGAIFLLDSKLYLSQVASLRDILSLYRYSTLFLPLITLLRAVLLSGYFLHSAVFYNGLEFLLCGIVFKLISVTNR